MFSYFSILSILTSLKVVFLTISSSSDSLNFLIATKISIMSFIFSENYFATTKRNKSKQHLSMTALTAFHYFILYLWNGISGCNTYLYRQFPYFWLCKQYRRPLRLQCPIFRICSCFSSYFFDIIILYYYYYYSNYH